MTTMLACLPLPFLSPPPFPHFPLPAMTCLLYGQLRNHGSWRGCYWYDSLLGSRTCRWLQSDEYILFIGITYAVMNGTLISSTGAAAASMPCLRKLEGIDYEYASV
jgi:hypothetical protein